MGAQTNLVSAYPQIASLCGHFAYNLISSGKHRLAVVEGGLDGVSG